MPRSFRTHMRTWMQSINMPETPLRKLFLTRYRALLDLRGVCPHNLACRGAAMEVLLNLSRFPLRQENYLKAVIRQIGRLIQENVQQMVMPEDDSTLWDVPGHVHGSSLRFSVIEDPPAAPPAALDGMAEREVILFSDDD
jgi:hypothetical protein